MSHGVVESVLFVDDEPLQLALCERAAQAAGAACLVASSGVEALALLAERPVFLVVSDFMMPGMSGLELLQVVRVDRPLLPFVFATGHADMELALEGLRGRAHDILEKPVPPAAMADLVRRYLAARAREIEEDRAQLAALREGMCDEARDLLADVDALLMALEADPPDPAAVDILFRKAHTVKGLAGGAFEGCAPLKDLMHEFEAALVCVKEGRLAVTGALVDLLLATADLARSFIERYRTEGAIVDDAGPAIARLRAVCLVRGDRRAAPPSPRKGTRTREAANRESPRPARAPPPPLPTGAPPRPTRTR